MIGLSLLAAAIAAFALFVLLRPLWTARGTAALRAQQEVLRDRLLRQLEELETDQGTGTMDSAVAASERTRLEYELAQVLKTLEQMPAQEAALAAPLRKQTLAITSVVVLALPLAAAGLYWIQNRVAIATFADYQGGVSTAGAGLPPMVMQMVGRLEQRLKEQPNDPQGWAQLGRSYGVLNRRDDALAAYAKAYELAPSNLDIVADYAWLVYSGDPRQPHPLAVKLYRQIYKAEPDNQDALWVLGLASYQAGNVKETKALWQRLLASLPPGTPAAQGVRSALNQLEQKPTTKP